MARRLPASLLAAGALAISALAGGPTATTQAAEQPDRPVARLTTGAPDCGTKRIPKPGGGYWRCSFADDFHGSRLDRHRWTVMSTAKHGYMSGTGACFVDDRDNVFVANGNLKLRTTPERPFHCSHATGRDFDTAHTSGSVSTSGHFKQTYGRYEFRVKFPTSRRIGLHSAVWLYPARMVYGPWPESGEIDIAELFTAYPDRLIPYVHYLRGAVEFHDTNEYCYVRNLGRYHKIVLVWTPRGMTVKYDGKLCMRARPQPDLLGGAPFDRPFTVVLTQALGVGHNQFRPGFTEVPATMSVDYVRVWR